MFPGFYLTAKCSSCAEYLTIPDDCPLSDEFLILHASVPIMQNSLEKSDM